jgi:hypothetical protein
MTIKHNCIRVSHTCTKSWPMHPCVSHVYHILAYASVCLTRVPNLGLCIRVPHTCTTSWPMHARVSHVYHILAHASVCHTCTTSLPMHPCLTRVPQLGLCIRVSHVYHILAYASVCPTRVPHLGLCIRVSHTCTTFWPMHQFPAVGDASHDTNGI